MSKTPSGRDGTGEEPISTKRLRSSEPDLTVIVKYTNDEGQPKEKTYSMYASVLANLSSFVDTTLSVPMREKTTREIVLQDVTPQVFEAALKFLDDSSAARSMNTDDALQVVEFYDKYGFSRGLRLCDQVFSDFFLEQSAIDQEVDEMTPPQDLDLLLRVIVLVEKFNLQGALNVGVRYMNEKLHCTIAAVEWINLRGSICYTIRQNPGAERD